MKATAGATGAGSGAGEGTSSAGANGFLYSVLTVITWIEVGRKSPEGATEAEAAGDGPFRLPRARPEPRPVPNEAGGGALGVAAEAAAGAAGVSLDVDVSGMTYVVFLVKTRSPQGGSSARIAFGGTHEALDAGNKA